MSGPVLAAIISAIGLVLSLTGSALIAGTRYGRMESDVTTIKEQQRDMVTKEEFSNVRDSVNEIKGMFRLTLKDP